MIESAEFMEGRGVEEEWERPIISGKFFSNASKKLWVKGVTYGTFRSKNGCGEFQPDVVERDFQLMQQNGINAVRTYTIPPAWLLDLAHQYRVRLLVGFPWEQHVAFLDDRRLSESIRNRLKQSVHEIARHPSLLGYAIGNEIPSSIVRWYGAERIQNYLWTLYETAKQADPDLLVTYVNYPSTEYLHLPFLDFFCFNVFLEDQTRFNSYVFRLQNLAGHKPLILTEIGLDSRRNGLEKQAGMLRSQIGSSFRAGCTGVFSFAWTDEWFRGESDIEDWDFGLTTRDRQPKPALDAVRRQFSENLLEPADPAPMFSVVVCSYNGSKTIEQCLASLTKLKYPNYETIVLDDGSTDSTAAIASKYPVRLIRTKNQGLSSARNCGMKEAKGEIIAYIDDDAYADPHWLNYLAIAFQETNYCCIGGPNLVPGEDEWIAQCVGRSPGGPTHVLLSDHDAEHVPGCNLAIRKSVLEAIGGFDPQFRIAGDDVDLCWRLENAGHKIGFHPGAMVWHHRRNSISSYFRQQRGYGKAEVLLARKWPEKYNYVGHVNWAGRIYGNGLLYMSRIYSGVWGTAPFQSLYHSSYGIFPSLFFAPEWLLLILFITFLTGLSFGWASLTSSLIFLAVTVSLPVLSAVQSSRPIMDSFGHSTKMPRIRSFILCVILHCIHLVARFTGRWPLWRPSYKRFIYPTGKQVCLWTEFWQDPSEKLAVILKIAKEKGAIVACGGSFDAWDLEAKGGAFASARLLMAVEEHGQGKQMTRFRIYAHHHWLWFSVIIFVLIWAASAAYHSAWHSAILLLAFSILLAGRILLESGRAMSALIESIRLFGRMN
ncbi:glycosyltransferase [bacterium]|nr:glycosyltransferase [bacterium]